MTLRKRLTLDDIYNPKTRINFDGVTYGDVIWLDSDHFLLRQINAATKLTDWTKVDSGTGASTRFYETERLQRALKGLPGMTDPEAERLAHLPNYVMNPSHTAVVLNYANDLYYYQFDADEASRLTAASAAAGEEFSPDGRMLTFVRENNLF